MLEAKIEKSELLKKILDAIRELVTDANWDCDETSMKLQAMDNSHIALVALQLNQDCFQSYRCDRNMSLGMNLGSFTKILKCAGNDDQVKITATDDSDVLGLQFQNRSKDRMGDYEMKLMDIDQEHLGIPETTYDASIVMPSTEFLRIVRDLKELGESVKIEVTKEGVKFSSEGEIGNAAVTLRPTVATTRSRSAAADSDDEDEENEDENEDEEMDDVKPKPEPGSDEEDVKPEVIDLDEEEHGSPAKKKLKTNGAKKKSRIVDSDEEEVEGGDDEEAAGSKQGSEDDEKPVVVDSDEESESAAAKTNKKRKAAAEKKKKDSAAAKKKKTGSTLAKGKSTTKGKTGAKKGSKGDEEDRSVVITLSQSVSLTFSIKYLNNFAKSTPLSGRVSLHMSAEVPLLVQYEFIGGSIRFYLAPKISDD